MKYSKSLMVFVLLPLFIVGNLYAHEYFAFSLKVAQERIEKAPKGQPPPDVFKLGGITAIRGLVLDRKTVDVILVGEKDPGRATLTLDDFVVALRARFIHGKWPLVSIDPTEEPIKTERQIVRFGGGIEDTQFGEDLFDADYRLKRIHMGILPPGIPGPKSYWDLVMEMFKERFLESIGITSRFWFYPVLPNLSVREDVVAIKGLKVGVFTEVLSAEIDGRKIENLATFQDTAGDIFAKAISDNFQALSRVHPSFLKLQGLGELVALTKAIEEMDERPELSYWLKDYQVKKVQTKKEVKVLKRSEEYELPMAGRIYKRLLRVSGGVQLMALALRLKAGDVTAFQEAVLKTRPKPDTLSWSFVVGEWIIPTSPEMLKMEDIAGLFFYAVFLQKSKRYEDAIKYYEKIIHLKPDWDLPYNNRGLTYEQKGQYDRAISDYNMAIEINPRCIECFVNRGVFYAQVKDQYDLAISDFNKAIEINPGLGEAYNNRGNVYNKKAKYDMAISDFNKAIEINPRYAEAYSNRGEFYRHKGQYEKAISDFNKAIEINPWSAEDYSSLGLSHDSKGEYDLAISSFSTAIEINPRYAEAYNNLGLVYKHKGEYDRAIFALNKALEINSQSDEFYSNRGEVYRQKGEYDRAMFDLNKALKVNSRLSGAYNNRGLIFEQKGQYDQAIAEYTQALKIDPKLLESFNNRGNAYQKKGRYDMAISDFTKALEINPGHGTVYYNRGISYFYQGQYDKAISDYDKAIEINPKAAEFYNNRGLAFRKKRQYGPAISDFNRALEINPTDAEVYFNKAEACDMAGRINEAIDAYKAFIQYAPPEYASRLRSIKEIIKNLELELRKIGR